MTQQKFQQWLNKMKNIYMQKQSKKSIEIASKKYQEQIQAEIYKTKFNNKEQALKQFQRIRDKNDISNFSKNCTKFQEQFPQYIKVLEQCIKYDLKKQILDVFPKDCIGCVIFSMIVCSNRIKRPQIAINFLNLMSNGWFNQELYYLILQKIKLLYRHLKYNEDLSNKSQIGCLRFMQYDKSIFEWISSQKIKNILKAKYEEKCQYPTIKSRQQFQQQFIYFKENQRLRKAADDILTYVYHKIYIKQFFNKSILLNIQNKSQSEQLKQNLLLIADQCSSQLSGLRLQFRHDNQTYKIALNKFYPGNNIFVLVKISPNKCFGGYYDYTYLKPDAVQGILFVYNFQQKKCQFYRIGHMITYTEVKKIVPKGFDKIRQKFFEENKKENQQNQQNQLKISQKRLYLNFNIQGLKFCIKSSLKNKQINSEDKKDWIKLKNDLKCKDQRENVIQLNGQGIQIYKLQKLEK